MPANIKRYKTISRFCGSWRLGNALFAVKAPLPVFQSKLSGDPAVAAEYYQKAGPGFKEKLDALFE